MSPAPASRYCRKNAAALARIIATSDGSATDWTLPPSGPPPVRGAPQPTLIPGQLVEETSQDHRVHVVQGIGDCLVGGLQRSGRFAVTS